MRLWERDMRGEERSRRCGVDPVSHVGGVTRRVTSDGDPGEDELAVDGDEVRTAGVAVAGAAPALLFVHRLADPGFVERVEADFGLEANVATIEDVSAGLPRGFLGAVADHGPGLCLEPARPDPAE